MGVAEKEKRSPPAADSAAPARLGYAFARFSANAPTPRTTRGTKTRHEKDPPWEMRRAAANAAGTRRHSQPARTLPPVAGERNQRNGLKTGAGRGLQVLPKCRSAELPNLPTAGSRGISI